VDGQGYPILPLAIEMVKRMYESHHTRVLNKCKHLSSSREQQYNVLCTFIHVLRVVLCKERWSHECAVSENWW